MRCTFELSEAKVARSRQVEPGVVLDFDRGGKVIGVEVFSVERRLPRLKGRQPSKRTKKMVQV